MVKTCASKMKLKSEQHRLFDFEFDTKLARTEIHFCDHNPKVLQIQRVYA